MRECPPAFVQILAPLGADERGAHRSHEQRNTAQRGHGLSKAGTGTRRLRFLEEGFAAIGIESISTRMVRKYKTIAKL